MGKWREKLKEMYAPQPCPQCGAPITAKQKRHIPVTKYSTWYATFECPNCHEELYLKGGWKTFIYTVSWVIILTFFELVIIKSHYIRHACTLVCLILACEGAMWFLVPFLPIAKRN